MTDQATMQQLLLSYVGLLAERHSYAPDEGFEYALWDDLQRGANKTTLVSDEEASELVYLAINTDRWVTYNVATGMFQLIDMDAWMPLLQKRGH
jgi:hypothetical protein